MSKKLIKKHTAQVFNPTSSCSGSPITSNNVNIHNPTSIAKEVFRIRTEEASRSQGVIKGQEVKEAQQPIIEQQMAIAQEQAIITQQLSLLKRGVEERELAFRKVEEERAENLRISQELELDRERIRKVEDSIAHERDNIRLEQIRLVQQEEQMKIENERVLKEQEDRRMHIIIAPVAAAAIPPVVVEAARAPQLPPLIIVDHFANNEIGVIGEEDDFVVL